MPTWASYTFGVALSPLTFTGMRGLLSTMVPTDDRLFLKLIPSLLPFATPTNDPAPPQDAPLSGVPQCTPGPDADGRGDVVFDAELEALESGVAKKDDAEGRGKEPQGH